MNELRRQMGLFQTTIYGIGLILGAGIYVLIGEAAGMAGDAVWISFAIGVIVAIFSGLSYAELASLFPHAAAEYVFVKNAFKNNFLAFLVGWLTVFTSIVSAAAVALGFGGYFAQFFDYPIVISAAFLLVILSVLNFIGIRESSWTNVVFTMIEAAGLVLIIYLGFTFTGAEPVNYFESPSGPSGIFLAFVLIFFAFIGFEDIVNIAEETKNPKKVLPRAIILSIVITGIIYMLVSLSAIRVLDWQELAASAAPLADVAGRALGSSGQLVLSLIALFATTNTVLIILLAGSRIIYGMAVHHSLPLLLGRVHNKTKTPWVSIIAIMCVSIIFLFVENITTVANIAVFAIAITFALVNLSVIILRYREPNLERSFKIPINVGKFPILSALGFVTTAFMITQFDWYVLSFGIAIIGIGTLFYVIYRNS